MSKLTLFQWTGFAPQEAVVDHRLQVSCAAAFPSKAAFLRAIDSKQSRMPYVSFTEVYEGREIANVGARLAIATPGVVFYHDTLRHAHNDAQWLVHPEPDKA